MTAARHVAHRAAAELGALAEPATIFPGAELAKRVEAHMVCNPDLGAVVVERQAGPLGLVTRVRLQTEMAGRLGYGRALHIGTRVQDLSATADALVLSAGTSLTAAGDAALGRERRRRYDEVVVAGEDGPAPRRRRR